MKQTLFLFFLCICLCSNALAYDIFNLNTAQSTRLLTGTGTDVICSKTSLFLDESPIESATYHASVVVISSARVETGDNVKFKAGTVIYLLPGFHVVEGAEFSATIEDCPESVAPTTEDVAESRNQHTFTTPLAAKQELSVYPNPFSYTTTVDFQLFEEQKVHLAIYSATQQLIKVLASNQTMSKGNYKYEFSGEDLVGGMYFVVSRTEETNLTKKLILVK